ncbi:hypothetical protein [Candidatus Phytoplasma mali]|nr:hypothetical protein [Candidatus Phytoplasma mali]
MQWKSENKNKKKQDLISEYVENNNNKNNFNNNLSLIEIKTLELLSKENNNSNYHNLEIEQKLNFQKIEQQLMIKDMENKLQQKLFEMEIQQKIDNLKLSTENTNNENNQINKDKINLKLNKEIIKHLKEMKQDIKDIHFSLINDKKTKTYYNVEEQILYINPYDLFNSEEDQNKIYLKN